MARKKKHPEHVNHERWLVSYADFITLLFAFFVVMFAVSQVDSNKVGRFAESVRAVTLWNGPQLTVSADQKSGSTAPAALIPTNVVVPGKAPGVDLRLMRELLRRRLRSAIVHSRITIEEDDLNLVVRLQDCGLFEPGSDRLMPQSVEDLRGFGEIARNLPYPVRIEGHTDSVAIRSGRFRNNWELSAARAVAVLECLSERGGMPDTRMSVAGYADTRPVASNATAEGRRRNRRVDIVLVGLAASGERELLWAARGPAEDTAPPVSGDAGIQPETAPRLRSAPTGPPGPPEDDR